MNKSVETTNNLSIALTAGRSRIASSLNRAPNARHGEMVTYWVVDVQILDLDQIWVGQRREPEGDEGERNHECKDHPRIPSLLHLHQLLSCRVINNYNFKIDLNLHMSEWAIIGKVKLHNP